MTPEEALKRAKQAEQVLANPITKDTLDFMEKELFEQWLKCPVRDVDGREAIWRLAASTRKFRELLHGTMESGKLAADELGRRKSAAERAKAAIESAAKHFAYRR